MHYPRVPGGRQPDRLLPHALHVPDDWQGRQVFLVFEGVDSAFYVWVNGRWWATARTAACRPSSTSPPTCSPARTSLAVQVYRWSDGSYLEDQDYVVAERHLPRRLPLSPRPPVHCAISAVRTDAGRRLPRRHAARCAAMCIATMPARRLRGYRGRGHRSYDADGQPACSRAALPASAAVCSRGEVTWSSLAATVPARASGRPRHPTSTRCCSRSGRAGHVLEVRSCTVGFRQVEIATGSLLRQRRRRSSSRASTATSTIPISATP